MGESGPGQVQVEVAAYVAKLGPGVEGFARLYNADAAKQHSILESAIEDQLPPAIRLLEKGTIDLRRLVTHVVSLSEYPQFMQEVVAGQVDGYIKGVVKL